MQRKFYFTKAGLLWWKCPCGARIEDESPETSLGRPISDADYCAESECGECGRTFNVRLSGILEWSLSEEGDIDQLACRKCDGDMQYCHTCGEQEACCRCEEKDMNICVCEVCENWIAKRGEGKA